MLEVLQRYPGADLPMREGMQRLCIINSRSTCALPQPAMSVTHVLCCSGYLVAAAAPFSGLPGTDSTHVELHWVV